MRVLIGFILLLSFSSFSQELVSIPSLNSPVIDNGEFLSQDEINQLSRKIQNLYQNSNWQPQILTISTLGDETIEQFAIRVADEWQLGSSEKDNGLIILIAREERKMRIEVGSGLEAQITDFEAHQIIRDILTPSFKKQDFAGGLKLAIEHIDSIVGTAKNSDLQLVKVKKKPEFAGLFPFVFFILVSILFSFSRRRSKTRKHSWLRGFISSILFSLPFLALGIHNVVFLSIMGILGFLMGFLGFHQVGAYSSGSRYRSRWRGGSGWSGGGGGFSGGGASGDW